MMKKGKINNFCIMYYIAFILHIIVIVCVWLSPFYVDWKMVALGSTVYLALGFIFKYCPLTKMQFGHTKRGFYEYYFEKIGMPINKFQSSILVRYIFPAIITFIAIIWQCLLGNQVSFILK